MCREIVIINFGLLGLSTIVRQGIFIRNATGQFITFDMEYSKVKYKIIQLAEKSRLLARFIHRWLIKKSVMFIALSACLLVLPTASVWASNQVLMNDQVVPAKHSEVWQNLIQALPKDQGVFNRALRESVREKLVLEEVSNIDVVESTVYQQRLAPKLQELDQSLQKFVRVSQSQTHFRQLEKLMPALFAIEEYKLIKRLYKQQKMPLPPLRNSRLLRLLDTRITQLANDMVFNMKALVRKRRPFEDKLLKAMASYGVKYSAKPSDFILDYDISFEKQNSAGEWEFNTSISLLNNYQIPIVKLNEIVVTEAPDEPAGQQKALEVMAKLVTMKLRIYLLKKK